MASSDHSWDPQHYARHARFVSDLGAPVIELLNPQPGERILDLGCGDGALTAQILSHGCDVLGVDSSSAMVAAAKSEDINAVVGDAEKLNFANEFDAVFSNAALHWMQQPEKVAAGVARALKSGGRFVGEFGGYGNVNTIVTALERNLRARGIESPSPWYFPTAEEYETLLHSTGFSIESIELFPRLTPLPGKIDAWLNTFGQSFIQRVPEQQRKDFVSSVVDEIRASLCNRDGIWHVDYVRLRFSASLVA